MVKASLQTVWYLLIFSALQSCSAILHLLVILKSGSLIMKLNQIIIREYWTLQIRQELSDMILERQLFKESIFVLIPTGFWQ